MYPTMVMFLYVHVRFTVVYHRWYHAYECMFVSNSILLCKIFMRIWVCVWGHISGYTRMQTFSISTSQLNTHSKPNNEARAKWHTHTQKHHISIRNNDPLCKMVPSELSLDISLSNCGFWTLQLEYKCVHMWNTQNGWHYFSYWLVLARLLLDTIMCCLNVRSNIETYIYMPIRSNAMLCEFTTLRI